MTASIDAEDLILLIGESTGPLTRVRDGTVLYSAAARPDATIMDRVLLKDPAERVAALLHAIVRWEPLDMWNAGFGWRAAAALASRDSLRLTVSPQDRMIIVQEIRDGRLNDPAAVAERLKPFMSAR
ncbi:hypothetical protein Ade02nite_75970 [Paractinoplanes deccanensis]|uniref:Death on curing protein n=1 Tax=Paractinoplanes deccanensis TaxID=113561 RepID=A0ABQ3YG38_9ACTN|nr:hypothetical protein [Actinoplanes deccanensis]GID78956.1 hypothetical protein Ade02nite_75970 [Actinoplanes deccanensis]